MIRLLLLALFGFLIYTLFTAVVRSLPGRGSPWPKQKDPQGEQMVRDPHCGTYVPRSEALAKTVKGERHYFCSERCRDAFCKSK